MWPRSSFVMHAHGYSLLIIDPLHSKLTNLRSDINARAETSTDTGVCLRTVEIWSFASRRVYEVDERQDQGRSNGLITKGSCLAVSVDLSRRHECSWMQGVS